LPPPLIYGDYDTDIKNITDTAAAGHPWATQARSYGYDRIDRLLTATATTPGNDTYVYDPLDNPTTVTKPAGTVNPTYNALNQIKTWGAKTYVYDADGNLLSGDGGHTYQWDAENRLIEIDYVGSSAKSNFSYDGLGHRLQDVETASGGGTTTTRYLWCGSAICQMRDGSDNVQKRLLDEGEYLVASSLPLLYMPDQLGSVRDVLNGNTGNLLESYDYTPYGTVARSTGSVNTSYRYAGLFYHTPSTLNLSATRPQDGNTGRWINRDFAKETGGVNVYLYGASPVNGVDPLGTNMTDNQSIAGNPAFASPSFQSGTGFNPGDVLGKIWTLPNTAIGILAGSGAYLSGLLEGTNPSICLNNNAIQFVNSPFGGGAITLGNTQIYSTSLPPTEPITAHYLGTGVTVVGTHEEAHTYQYQLLGPFFLPTWAALGGASPSNPLETSADLYAEGQGGPFSGFSCGCSR
jgi:RHS repeat-associated protein